MKISLSELIQKLELIKEIEIETNIYKINFFLGGDLKWLSNVLGINAANSKYPCPWCKWEVPNLSKEKLSEKEFDEKVDYLSNMTFNIDRNHEEATRFLSLKNLQKNGYKNEGLFKFIPFKNVIFDILHMSLRISDRLFKMLLFRLEELEGDSSSDLKKRFLTKKFIDFISERTKITNPFYFKLKMNHKENVETSSLKMRKLNLKERLSLIEKFDEVENLRFIFGNKYQNDNMLKRLSRLFGVFKDILKIIKADNFNQFDKNNLVEELKSWVHNYLKTGYKLTPYIHCFVYHVPEFIEKYGNLNCFSMQNLEKYNHIDKTNYFRATNRKTEKFTLTLIQKMNRVEYIRLTSI